MFSYEPGTAMITGTAPARRVGFFVSNGTVEHDREHRTTLRRCSLLGSGFNTDRVLCP
ncbi:MAG: hypothetical protein V9F03_10360 [Microthrixaceae bacterium]